MSDPNAPIQSEIVQPNARPITAFGFGDPEPVLDRGTLLGMMGSYQNGQFYEPPVQPSALARAFYMSPHHASAIVFKRNMLTMTFRPSKWLDRKTFGKFVKDYLAIGNAYLERKDSVGRSPMRLDHSMAVYTRRGVVEGEFFFVPRWKIEHAFAPGSVFHLYEPDLEQELYGIPEWLPALQSGLLNESATLFRRRYYINGSHAGFILYLSEPTMGNEDADAIRQALRDSKGIGNFRNLFLHAPSGKKDGVQLIPISEVAARDEFLGIKDTTRDDILAAHRVPPQLLGLVPKNTGGFGDPGTASTVFFRNEIVPLQMRMLEINDWLGREAVVFDDYEPPVAPKTGG